MKECRNGLRDELDKINRETENSYRKYMAEKNGTEVCPNCGNQAIRLNSGRFICLECEDKFFACPGCGALILVGGECEKCSSHETKVLCELNNLTGELKFDLAVLGVTRSDSLSEFFQKVNQQALELKTMKMSEEGKKKVILFPRFNLKSLCCILGVSSQAFTFSSQPDCREVKVHIFQGMQNRMKEEEKRNEKTF